MKQRSGSILVTTTACIALIYTGDAFTSCHRTLLYPRTVRNHPSVTFYDASLPVDSAEVDNSPSTSSEATTSLSSSNEKPIRGSKRSMMKFAVPALGIFLASPLLSNIDNAFVGRTVGSAGLAALSPGTICTDTLLYLFSFLSRATTGIVSRAFAAEDEETTEGNIDAAREAASAPLSVALISGVILSCLYAYFTPNLLEIFNVDLALRKDAASYIYWRGAFTWAALFQSIALTVLLATRDAITPLKIVTFASVLNIVGDYMLCVWPVKWGCAGAAAATSAATLISSGFLLQALRKKRLLPAIRFPSRKQLGSLMEFTGPLLAITLTRMGGLIAMQKSAMALGVQSLAAYQMCINLVIFFLLFGEPLSQLSQTKLPSLVDAGDRDGVKATLKSVGTLSVLVAASVGGIAFASLQWCSGLFSSDPIVQMMSRNVAPAVFMTVVASIASVAIDGAMLASRDFGFMLTVGLTTFIAQLGMLRHSTSLSWVFGSFTMRLGIYSILALVRGALGYGPIGRMLKKKTT
ncbi:hypothetical protein MPSEU_000229000 [Mayamaea pseudoterrestris]|nr:hypothetical protein MPSEU_000229000 [Mayamaea pseudoterrestris]